MNMFAYNNVSWTSFVIDLPVASFAWTILVSFLRLHFTCVIKLRVDNFNLSVSF